MVGWYEASFDRSTNSAILSRSLLRVLPLVTSSIETSGWTHDHHNRVLAAFRCALISLVAAKDPSSELEELGESASTSLHKLMDAAPSPHQMVPAHALASCAYTAGCLNQASPSQRGVEALSSMHRAMKRLGHADSFLESLEKDLAMTKGVPSGILRLMDSELGVPWDSKQSNLSSLNPMRASDNPETYWRFWKIWYEGVRTGKPLPWALQSEVALIPDEEWENGPERIAEVIRGIEAEFVGGPIADAVKAERERSGNALKRHVQRLLEQSAASEFNALGLAWQIKSAIAEHCNRNGINETPEELRSFEAIAKVLARIGGSLAQSRINDEIRDQLVEKLETQIAELQLRIKALRKELDESKAKEVKGLVKQGFYHSLGPTLVAACTTTIVGAANYFMAPEYAPDIVRHLGDQFTGMFEKPPQYFPQIGKD